MKVYHFTNRNNIDRIMKEGLILKSSFEKLNSRLRKKAIYAVLTPYHDAMGYLNDVNYECLEVEIDSLNCYVADMDIISAAYINYIGAGGQKKDLSQYKELVDYYDESSVRLIDYIEGMFRSPEVIIPYAVELEKIQICNKQNYARTWKNNTSLYNDIWTNRLRRISNNFEEPISKIVEDLVTIKLIKKVASLESKGRLNTYKVIKTEEYFSLQL